MSVILESSVVECSTENSNNKLLPGILSVMDVTFTWGSADSPNLHFITSLGPPTAITAHSCLRIPLYELCQVCPVRFGPSSQVLV